MDTPYSGSEGRLYVPSEDITKSELPRSAGAGVASADAQEEERSEPEIRLSPATDEAGVPVEDNEHVLEGEELGRYLLVGELATGGMAEIFLAVQKGLEGVLKVVVVKRVLPHLTSHPNFRQMFADEARVAARLEHPNIVRTYDFGASDEGYFTVMEYLAGEDLASLMRRIKASKTYLQPAATAWLIAEICKGLHFAHELTDTAGRPMGLVHRDLNPSNLILTYAGEVKVIDFGVVKTTTNMSKTKAGTLKGKMAYMAPEQIAARPFDRRVDVFSTGVVMWQLLAMRTLFNRDSEMATMNAIMNDPLAPPSRHRPEVPPELDAIVMKALARTPADRYASMEELQTDLETFIASQPPLDRKWLTNLMESQFGVTRADAKRAIAQTRSLRRNIATVMRFRTDVSSRPSGRLDTSPVLAAVAEAESGSFRDGSSHRSRSEISIATPAPAPKSRTGLIVGSIAVLALAGVGAFFALRGDSKPVAAVPTTARVVIESAPAGANVLVDGEPTGLVTPAHLDGLRPGAHAVRVELAGHRPTEETITATAGQQLIRSFTLHPVEAAPAPDVVEPAMGQLAVGGLPADATFFVGEGEYIAGDVVSVPVGKYKIRVVSNNATLVDQEIEVGVGHQLWERRGAALVKR